MPFIISWILNFIRGGDDLEVAPENRQKKKKPSVKKDLMLVANAGKTDAKSWRPSGAIVLKDRGTEREDLCSRIKKKMAFLDYRCCNCWLLSF